MTQKAAKQSNVPKNGLKWTYYSAESEWGTDRATIKAKLTQAGIQPDEDGFFTTLQLLAAMTGGDIRVERLRLTREQADHLAFVNARDRDQFLSADDVRRSLEEVFNVMRAEVLGNSDLSEAAQDSLLSHLSGYRIPS